MSDFDLGRAARLLATALLAAFVIEMAGSMVQMFTEPGGLRYAVPTKVSFVYAALAVSAPAALLLVVGLIVLAARPDRSLLGFYAAAAVVAFVIAVAGLVFVPSLNDSIRSVQGWRLASGLGSGAVLNGAVAVLAVRARSTADGGAPRAWAN